MVNKVRDKHFNGQNQRAVIIQLNLLKALSNIWFSANQPANQVLTNAQTLSEIYMYICECVN